jgi:uncharacterized integral membrane protein
MNLPFAVRDMAGPYILAVFVALNAWAWVGWGWAIVAGLCAFVVGHLDASISAVAEDVRRLREEVGNVREALDRYSRYESRQ